MTVANSRPTPRHPFKFSDCELDPDNFVLLKGGMPVKLPPQPFKVLALLASRHGQLVTREEICRAVWADDVTVDFEHGLNTCIRQIRGVLGDDAETGRIIETVPRVGYRLAAPVVEVTPNRTPFRQAVVVATTLGLAGTLLVAWAARRVSQQLKTQPIVAELNALGRSALGRRTIAGTVVARQLFEQSSAVDPASAKAQAGIAATYLTEPNSLAAVSVDEARAKSATAVARALALGPEEAAAHTAAAQARRIAHDWAGAVREHRRAIELGPNEPAAHVAYSATLVLIGDFETALHEARRAKELDGLSPVTQEAVAVALRFARRYEEAIIEARKALDLDPTYGPAYLTLGQCYEATGRVEDAIGYYEQDGQPNGNRAHAYAVAGRTADARALLAKFEARYTEKGTGAGEVAMAYIGLREYDRAFEWLERAVAGGTPLTLKVSPVWDPLRPDPRFESLLDRLDLGEHSRSVVIATAAR